MTRKTVVIGMDGVPLRLIEELTDSGDMPNCAHLRKEGYLSSMHSAVPEVSNVNWSSIVTGANPGEHGIYGFTELIPGTHTVCFPDRRALKAPPFWSDNSKRYVLLNIPAMYPAPEVNGVFVSGFVAPDLDKAVKPMDELEYLRSIDYEVDVDSSIAHKSHRLFLERLFETLEKREKAYRYYWTRKWDVFMLVFTGSDRLEHFLMDAYADEEHEYHEEFIRYFREIDRIVGDIYGSMDEGSRLVMLSDHGMEPIKINVNVNALLEQNGLLELGGHPEKRYNNIVDEGTSAFALDPGRIYLRDKDVAREVVKLFEGLKYEGEDVIGRINLRDDVYHGPEIERAPDIVLTPNSGYNIKGGVKYDGVFEKNIFKGKHTASDAFLYCNEKCIPRSPTVEDVRDIIEK